MGGQIASPPLGYINAQKLANKQILYERNLSELTRAARNLYQLCVFDFDEVCPPVDHFRETAKKVSLQMARPLRRREGGG